MGFQADDLRLYSAAFALGHRPEDRRAAADIARYLLETLRSDQGVFFTSQDADAGVDGARYYAASLAERRKIGAPRIDRHVYARENGWAIRALASYAGAFGNEDALVAATAAANWVIAHRQVEPGAYAHDEGQGALHFGDTLAMAEAFLELYTVTADRRWLSEAERAASVLARFRQPTGGFITTIVDANAIGVFKRPVLQLDENLGATRFFNLLGRHTGEAAYAELARHGMRHLAEATVASERLFLSGILSAADEVDSEPMHVVVVGAKTDPAARALYAEALRLPSTYRRLEWWDPAEEPLPDPAARYPSAGPAAYVCVNGGCSAPIRDPAMISAALARLTQVR